MAQAALQPSAFDEAAATAFAEAQVSDPARLAAWETFKRLGAPHRRLEAWKWTDLRRALDAASPAVLMHQDWLSASRTPDAEASLHGSPCTAMPALAGAFAPHADIFRLGADAPSLELSFNAPPGASNAIMAIEIEAGARVIVEERYGAQAGAFANAAIQYRLGEGAQLTRLVRQAHSPGGVIVSTVSVDLAKEARLNQFALTFGAELARLETHVVMQGEGAHAEFGAAYLLNGGLHADLTSSVSYEAPDCSTRQLVKGVAADAARGVFQGKFTVARAAQRTDARMGHHALLLSSKAGVNAKPELEIYADDVQCAHGNTMGALDERALFYMRARGLPEQRARALLMRAFVLEAFETVGDEALQQSFEAEIDAWLERAA